MENEKFLVVADIHGSMSALDRVLELAETLSVQKIVILGDTFGVNADAMVEKLNLVADKLVIVKGNNDWYYEPQNAKFKLENHTYINVNGVLAYVCHGHRLDDMNLDAYGAKLIMQGHVHRPFIENRDGVIRFCPGSIASPRFGSAKSFAIIDAKNVQIFDEKLQKINEIMLLK